MPLLSAPKYKIPKLSRGRGATRSSTACTCLRLQRPRVGWLVANLDSDKARAFGEKILQYVAGKNVDWNEEEKELFSHLTPY